MEKQSMTVQVNVGDEQREITIYVNDSGNIVLDGVGSVGYEMYDEELVLIDGGY